VNRISSALAAILLVVLGLWFHRRGGGAGRPESVVSAWYDAAARGDEAACLALTDGPLRSSLRSTLDQQGREAFRAGLRASAAGLRGISTRRLGEETDAVALEVELVYEDRNERQTARLVRRAGRWRLAELGGAEAVRPPVRYGTPVYE